MHTIYSSTRSVCPECLKVIPARRVKQNGCVYYEKACPDHGDFSAVIWREADTFDEWLGYGSPPPPQPAPAGCPFKCLGCSVHGQQPCCVLLEVTQRCDLSCSFCFADSGRSAAPDPSLQVVETWYDRLLDFGGPFNIQLSGGEPCMRDDLADIISMGRSMGFSFFQVNTNGLRIATDDLYLKRLKDAGLSTVYLQFDAVDDAAYERLRCRCLFDIKRRAVDQCGCHQLGVVLVATIVPGVNDGQMGDIIRFGLSRTPVVRGVHFQPVSYFGRYPDQPGDSGRITLPEVMQAIETQTDGLVTRSSLRPPAATHPLCSFHGNFVHMPDGNLRPLSGESRECGCSCGSAAKPRDVVARAWSYPCAKPPDTGLSLGGWDDFIDRARTHHVTISGMVFQDAWTLDLDRLHRCYLYIMHPDGYPVPFCAYNLTGTAGRSLYRSCAETSL